MKYVNKCTIVYLKMILWKIKYKIMENAQNLNLHILGCPSDQPLPWRQLFFVYTSNEVSEVGDINYKYRFFAIWSVFLRRN